MAFLPGHLESMQAWVHLASEVVVVDSLSNDGTVEYIKANLHHARLRLLSCPPGLYESWNFGIQHITAPYCYISTVGDSISQDGLRHLLQAAESLACDVVVSKPKFLDSEGRGIAPTRWPIDDIIESLSITSPVALSRLQLMLFALIHYREALLGSSASNLYKTAALQKYPFPTNFGTVGDGAWALCFWPSISFAVTPRAFSTFRVHAASYSREEYKVANLSEKLLNLIRRSISGVGLHSQELQQWTQDLELPKMAELLQNALLCQNRLEAARKTGLPWSLNPFAWQDRAQRQRYLTQANLLKQEALARIVMKPT